MDKSLDVNRITTVILAAGASRRFGANKLLQPFNERPLIQHAVRAAKTVCNAPLMIVGRDWDAVLESADSNPCFFIRNEQYEQGMGGSIALAARVAFSRGDALLLLLGDQPLIESTHLQRLIDGWNGSSNHIVATRFKNIIGPPVLIPKGASETLSQLSGDAGARFLFEDPKFDVDSIEHAPAAFDIDVPDDIKRATQQLSP